jgi:hypothetical protein
LLEQARGHEHGVVKMESFGLNTARSFLGKNVNLHLKDGSVIVNVHLSQILKDDFKRQTSVQYVSRRKRGSQKILLRSIAWAEMLNPNFILINQ